MSQKTFTFKKRLGRAYPIGYIPTQHITTADEFKARVVKQGYLVKNVRKYEWYECEAARANIPHKERQKAQNEIDSAPPQNTFKITPQ